MILNNQIDKFEFKLIFQNNEENDFEFKSVQCKVAEEASASSQQTKCFDQLANVIAFEQLLACVSFICRGWGAAP